MSEKDKNKDLAVAKVETPVKEPVSPLPQARRMTRREMRALRDAGFDPALNDAMAGENPVDISRVSSGMVDHILDNIYPDFDFDDVPYDACLKLASETYGLSMGFKRSEDEKNS